MSTPQKSKIIPTENLKKALTPVIVVMVVLLGVGVFSYFLGKNQGEKNKTLVPVIDAQKISNPAVLGAQTFSWNGKITKIEKSKITFSTTVTNDQGVVSSKDLIASISSNTQLIKWDVSKPPSTDGTSPNQTTIGISQFKLGQQIIVQSPLNYNNQNTIDAASISLLITPTSQ